MKLIKLTEFDLHQIINECVYKLMNESYERPVFYDYLEDYGVSYVFNEFLSNPKGKEDWLPLIDPSMYIKALREFTQYGRLIKFPTKYIYQWMGIIMKNTAMLIANNTISGHDSSFPIDDCYDFLESWFGDGRFVKINDSDDIIIELTPSELINICNGKSLNEVTDKFGQQYFPFVNQDETDRISKKTNSENFISKNQALINMIDKYNKSTRKNDHYIEVDSDNNRFLYHSDVYSLLDDIGIYDWMAMPDGSDAWSDFGISPLCEIINEYNDDLSPEKVLVLINRCLDVSHQRGDLSSIFIKGGRKTLDYISGT